MAGHRVKYVVYRPAAVRAIVDRLTFGGNINQTGTVCYRLAHTRAQRAG